MLKLHSKPIGLLNVAGYFDPILAWLEKAFDEGFISTKHRGLIAVGETAEELIEALVCSR